MHTRFLSLLAFAALAGCVAPPDWVPDGRASLFPATRFLTGHAKVAATEGFEGAARKARAALAEAIRTTIQKDVVSSERATVSVQDGRIVDSYDFVVNVTLRASSNVELRGARIAEYWSDTANDALWALAVLELDAVVRVLGEQIRSAARAATEAQDRAMQHEKAGDLYGAFLAHRSTAQHLAFDEASVLILRAFQGKEGGLPQVPMMAATALHLVEEARNNLLLTVGVIDKGPLGFHRDAVAEEFLLEHLHKKGFRAARLQAVEPAAIDNAIAGAAELADQQLGGSALSVLLRLSSVTAGVRGREQFTLYRRRGEACGVIQLPHFCPPGSAIRHAFPGY